MSSATSLTRHLIRHTHIVSIVGDILTAPEAIPATVRWRNGRALGCTFDRPLSPYIFEHLQRAAH